MTEQGTEEWRLERLGLVTGSRVSDVMAKIKTGEAACRVKYKTELACERITGIPMDYYESFAMRRGKEMEMESRLVYETYRGVFVEQTGFIKHGEMDYFGASPDGLVGADGLVELKNPEIHTHASYLLKNEVPSDYMWQVQSQLEVTGREWCDWVSYRPEFGAGLELLCIRVVRNEKMIKEMKEEITRFNNEVDQLVIELNKRRANG